MKVLIIEDEQRMAELLAKGLSQEKYTVDIALDGRTGLDLALIPDGADIIILDLMLPDISGLSILRSIRSEHIDTPVLILTAKDSIDDKVAGLDMGADDYLVKPFSFDELLARIRSLLRSRHTTDICITADSVTLDPKSRTVTRMGKAINLSAKEFSLLEYLIRNKNIIVNEGQIIQHVWPFDYQGESNIVRVYIRYLRNKIDRDFPDCKPLVTTVRGLGYKLSD